MLETYKATLRGDRLMWHEGEPIAVSKRGPRDVLVTILNDSGGPEVDNERGKRMATALRALAARNTLTLIADPAQWERETRQDRPLPGREP